MKRKSRLLSVILTAACIINIYCSSSDETATGDITEDQIASLIEQIRSGGTDTAEILTDAEILDIQKRLRALEPEPVEEGEFAVLDTDKGIMIFKFFTAEAPNHSANFKKLANFGFYDWVKFYRVVSGFMIQSGCIFTKNNNPTDDGGGHPGYFINDEFNSIPFDKGIVGMAKRTEPNSAGSQFFFMHVGNHSLNGRYTAFGKVVYGLEVIDEIAGIETRGERAVENVYIKRARVIKP
ncbi:MAG: peptidylprolyl isomerase [bacterium]|nr:peptidylprolyl isomerase [bacterium]